MSTESYSNDETLLFFILIMVLQFAMIFFFQMSFVYTGFPKSWHVFYWCWAEPEKACASKCSQHLQGLGNPQAISGLITILILGESLCLSFLIIRISRHTSPLWLWSHLLCCRSVCVWKQLQTSSPAEPSTGWESCPRSIGSTVSKFWSAVGTLFSISCWAARSISLISMLWSLGSIFSLFWGVGNASTAFPQGSPVEQTLSFHTLLLSRIVL